MKAYILLFLLSLCLSQFQKDIGTPDVTKTIDVTSENNFWVASEMNKVIEFTFPVNHSEGGYSWHLDELYHDCNLDFYQEPWFYQDDPSMWFYQEQFFQSPATGFENFDDHQKAQVKSTFIQAVPNWTFRKS